MRKRWSAALLVVTLVAGGCGDDDGDDASPATTTAPSTSTSSVTGTVSTTQPTVTSTATEVGDPTETTSTTVTVPPGLPRAADACRGVDDDLYEPDPTITFTDDGRIWEARRDGQIVCLIERLPERARDSLEWSPLGDKLLLHGGEVMADGDHVFTDAAGAGELLGWTWPTGRRFLATDGATLQKFEADGSGATDISIADDHSVLAYHPDGLHFAVFGTVDKEFVEFDEDGNEVVEVHPVRGLFVVDNDGSEPQLLIDSAGAAIVDVAFSEDGARLTILVDHDGTFHLHSFVLPDMVTETGDERFLGALPEDPDLIEPQVESDVPLSDLVVAADDPDRVAFAAGDLVQVYDFTTRTQIDVAPDLAARPVGFMGADTVVIHTADREVWAVNLTTEARQFISSAGAAAIRDVAPDLAFSLDGIIIRGFA